MKSVRVMIKNNEKLWDFLACAERLLGRNQFHVSDGNRIEMKGARIRKSRFDVGGTGNTVCIGRRALLQGASVKIAGNGNRVVIADDCALYGAECYIEDDNNEILVEAGTAIYQRTQLAAIEGTKVQIGKNCLLSSDIQIRTGDSHTILDRRGVRINPSKDVQICEHVWLGARVMVLKGVSIARDCVVGAGSIVTKSCLQAGSILAGVPAKSQRQDINWCVERIPIKR